MMLKTLCLLSLLSMSDLDHDIHVSVCDIEVSQASIEVTLKTFIDDLQLAVGLQPGEDVPSDYTSADDLISKYISSTIKLHLDRQDIDLRIEDISASNDAIWITLTSDLNSADNTNLSIDYTFLTELYADQTNIININHNQRKKTFSLNHKKKEVSYELD